MASVVREWAKARKIKLRGKNGISYMSWPMTIQQMADKKTKAGVVPGDFAVAENGWVVPNGLLDRLIKNDVDYISINIKEFPYRLWTTPTLAKDREISKGGDVVIPQYIWTRNPLEFQHEDRGFVHLHVRSDYSYHESPAHVRDLCERASRVGQPGIALTDRYRIMGTWGLRKEVALRKIVGLAGATVLISEVAMAEHGDQNYELVLIATNETGWHNLLKLLSLGWTTGMFHSPRIDHECLAEHSEGLVCLSSGLQGKILQSFAVGDSDLAVEEIEALQEIFGDRFYLEIAPWVDEFAVKGMLELAEYATENDVQVVVTGDVQWTSPWDTDIARIVRADDVRNKKMVVDPLTLVDPSLKDSDPPAYKLELDKAKQQIEPEVDPVHHLSTSDELREMFEQYHPAVPYELIDRGIAATIDILDLYEPYGIDEQFKMPETEGGSDVFKIAEKNLKRLGLMDKPEYRERFDMERAVLEELGFVPYFQLLNKIVEFMNEKEILKGPGRGSAAGSLISYGLEITDLDPIKYGLIFERFVNKGRVSLPDIDIDINSFRRDEVYEFVTKIYPNVANIPTILTMKGKASIKTVCRSYNKAGVVSESLSQEVPEQPQNAPPNSLMEGLQYSLALQDLLTEEPDVFMAALRLEGTIYAQGQHPAGIVVSPIPLDTNLGLMVAKPKGKLITLVQAPMHDVDKQGYIKLDLLASTTVTGVDMATLSLMPDSTFQERKDWLHAIDLDDKRTMALIRVGDTKLSFQFNSRYMMQTAKTIQPKCFDDCIALNAIVRPGAQDWIEEYAKGTYRPKQKALWPIVKNTRGVLLYQEQAIRCASDLAGMSLSRSDMLRKAVAKKVPKLMREMEAEFVSGCMDNDMSEKDARAIFEIIRAGQNYSFNKCLDNETEIRTTNGQMSINSIRERLKDGLSCTTMSLDPKTGENYETECVEVVDCGEQEVFQIKFDDGSQQVCTTDHQFVCTDGKKHTLEEILNKGLDVTRENMKKLKTISVKHVGTRRTSNLVIDDPNHNFVLANGAVSGNSHAASYSQLAMWTLYLYLNHTAHFITGFINSRYRSNDRKKKILDGINAAHSKGIELKPPAINSLTYEFITLDDKSIQVGAGCLPFVKEKAVEAVHEAITGHHADMTDEQCEAMLGREPKPFTSIKEFDGRVPRREVNKRVKKALALAGAFDEIGSRRPIFEAFDQELERKKTWDEREWLESGLTWSPAEKIQLELEFLKFKLSNPIKENEKRLKVAGWRPMKYIRGKGYKLTGGYVQEIRVWTPQNGKGEMAKLDIDDGSGGGQILIWQSAWPSVANFEIQEGDFIFVKAYELEKDPGTLAVGPKGKIRKMDLFYKD